MSNKDLVNPVLEGIVSDATNNLRTNIEQTTPTDTITPTTDSNIQPTIAIGRVHYFPWPLFRLNFP